MPKKTWNYITVKKLFKISLIDLIFRAHTMHKLHFTSNEIELCTLLSIKTGGCPEDCAYCPQSAHYKTGVQKENLLNVTEVVNAAIIAKKNGATRFCMGAAWRQPPAKHFPKVLEMIAAVKALGLETCVTLGMLTKQQAGQLKEAGLDFYNHNLDTSPEYYKKIISTRTYQDRLHTLNYVRQTEIKVCCGGIIGMGKSRQDRIELLLQLANLPQPPDSIPINRLIPIAGTPLAHVQEDDPFEFIRTIAIARIMMPKSVIRLSAGRMTMSAEMQTLCFMAGANSLWLGERLLTTNNPDCEQDNILFKKLGLKAKKRILPATLC